VDNSSVAEGRITFFGKGKKSRESGHLPDDSIMKGNSCLRDITPLAGQFSMLTANRVGSISNNAALHEGI
jgi:hypothetical protein